MAKKKAGPKKPKKLRLVNRSPIGLSNEQQKELSEKYRPLARLSGGKVSIKDIVALRDRELDRLVYLYVEAICHDARCENLKKRPQTVALRKSILRDIEKLCGRDFSPDDIIRHLAKLSPVPDFAASAIRRDYLTISIK